MENTRKKLQSDLFARVESCLSRYCLPSRPRRIFVGFSGGLDSSALLHLAARICAGSAYELCAVHVHHGLSPNADQWAAFASQFAKSLGVECKVVRVEVNQRAELGLEAAAREARYAVFEQLHCDVLLLAQHLDDQAETVLLNLLRGSGVRGLAAMPECRFLSSGTQLLRPLLGTSRAELLAYAQAHQLQWVEDESNSDQTFDRNFLRHSILPQINKAFPGASAALARSAAHFAEAGALLTELASSDLHDCVEEEAFNLVVASTCLSDGRLRNVLRYWLGCSGVVPDTRAFDELLRMMREARPDAQPVWAWRDRVVRRYRNKLYLTSTTIQIGSPVAFEWQRGTETIIPNRMGRLGWSKAIEGFGIAERALAGRLELRPRAGGEALRLYPNGPTRSLKHLYQEAGVPPWLRESIPILWIDGRIAAVPGRWIAEEFLEPGGWQVSWYSGVLSADE